MLEKSKEAAFTAIGCYNHPNNFYRDETFAILMVNAWELLIKAVMVKKSGKKTSIYQKDKDVKRKDGIPITMSEEELFEIYPLMYRDFTLELKDKYKNFKQNEAFRKALKKLKKNNDYVHASRCNPKEKSGSPKYLYLYSQSIVKELGKLLKLEKK